MWMTRSSEQHATDARTLDVDHPPGVDNTEPTPLSAPAHIRRQQESVPMTTWRLGQEPDRDSMWMTRSRAAHDQPWTL